MERRLEKARSDQDFQGREIGNSVCVCGKGVRYLQHILVGPLLVYSGASFTLYRPIDSSCILSLKSVH